LTATQPAPAPAAGLQGWRQYAAQQLPLVTSASALVIGAAANSVLGFLYWWLAARQFAPQAVGVASAAISMMNLLAHVGELGLGTLLMGEISGFHRGAMALISAALLFALTSSTLFGLLYVLVAHQISQPLGAIVGVPRGDVLFVAGCALTGFIIVLDQVYIGLRRSLLQMWRNVGFAVIKLAFLLAAAFVLKQAVDEVAILGTWVIAQICSLLLLTLVLSANRQTIWRTPRFGKLRPLLGYALAHHLLNVVVQMPGFALPFVVTVVLSPQINAAFYAGWTLLNMVLLVPASLTTVLFALGKFEPAALSSQIRLSLALSTAIGALAGIGCLLLSPFILGLFSPLYAVLAGSSLRLLGFGILGVMVKFHYIAVQRLRNRVVQAAAILGAGSTLELVAAVVGGRAGGLMGLTLAWLLAVFVQAVIMLPVVVRGARFGYAPRSAAASSVQKPPSTPPTSTPTPFGETRRPARADRLRRFVAPDGGETGAPVGGVPCE
jgi:O-antigen/teichoic acid export membrane protein